MKLEVKSSLSQLLEEISKLLTNYEQSIYAKNRDQIQKAIRLRLRDIRQQIKIMKN